VVGARALVAVLALATATSASAARSTGETPLHALDAGVLAQMNAIRVEHGLQPLKLDASLESAAAGHSDEMLADGYFAHESFDGSPFWTRLAPYCDAADGYSSVGENLLRATAGIGAHSALVDWMRSPEHRQNILTSRWRDVGISAVRSDGVTVITTDFGVRRPSSSSSG
jgi:uncharacterized protein YkwD